MRKILLNRSYNGPGGAVAAPPPPAGIFLAFRGIDSPAGGETTGGSGTTTEMVLDTEMFDTAGAFAANRFTAPVDVNGSYMTFNAGFVAGATESIELQIQRSTDGGTNFTTIAGVGNTTYNYFMCTTGPIQVNTGEVFRAAFYMYPNNSTGTMSYGTSLVNTFFAGYTSP